MEEIVKVAMEEFEKKPDGSWVCVKNSDITCKSGRIIRIAPGTVFRKGNSLAGLDVADALDKISAG